MHCMVVARHQVHKRGCLVVVVGVEVMIFMGRKAQLQTLLTWS